MLFYYFAIALFTEKKKGKSGEGITVKAHEIVARQKGVAIQRQHV